MWTHWGYKQNSPIDLEQGDVLRPEPALLDLIREYHPYYAGHVKNQFYIVLTQSCDLVRRSGPCSARYIALAPVRSLRNIVALEFGAIVKKIDGATYASTRVRNEVERFLARLFNNNEPAYYYLEQEQGAGLAEPMCAMLSLPISFKNDHYETFVNARLIGIEDSFQAKLGSSLGQLYSRVGTQDFTDQQIKDKVFQITNTLALWLEGTDVAVLENLVEEHRATKPDVPIDNDVLIGLVEKIPKKKAAAIQLILDIATEAKLIATPSPERRLFRQRLENSTPFAAYFK
jgi:hypothetical protein